MVVVVEHNIAVYHYYLLQRGAVCGNGAGLAVVGG